VLLFQSNEYLIQSKVPSLASHSPQAPSHFHLCTRTFCHYCRGKEMTTISFVVTQRYGKQTSQLSTNSSLIESIKSRFFHQYLLELCYLFHDTFSRVICSMFISLVKHLNSSHFSNYTPKIVSKLILTAISKHCVQINFLISSKKKSCY